MSADAEIKTGKVLCGLVVVVATIHFVLALAATGTGTGLGMDVFLAGYFTHPWQAVIDGDLMLGLLLAAAWILWRERDRSVGLTWIIVMFWWGNLILAIYVYRQLSRSGGQWPRFFMGEREAAVAPAPLGKPWPPSVRGLLCVAAAAAGLFAVWGCLSVQFAFIPSIGYVWGVGSLALAATMMAVKTGPRQSDEIT